MPRWPAGLHRIAASLPNRGGRARAIPRIPLGAYTQRLTGLPLTGGQAQGVIPLGGALTLSTGPQGLGTAWYPVQVTLSTTSGVLDTSTATVYLGAQGIPVTQVGQLYSGNGTVALAIPVMTPGQVLIIQWAGANPGDTAAANIIGTMDALTTALYNGMRGRSGIRFHAHHHADLRRRPRLPGTETARGIPSYRPLAHHVRCHP